MVGLYVNGEKVGTLADFASALPQFTAENKSVILKDDVSGRTLGTFTPEPICPWEPNLTREEIDRRCQQKGKPLSEILKKLGAE
jgi:hypothetical protein